MRITQTVPALAGFQPDTGRKRRRRRRVRRFRRRGSGT
jgi:hypothetical protein